MAASIGPVLKVLLLREVTRGTEEHGELPAIFTRNGYSCELTLTFGKPSPMGGWVSVLFALAGAILWMSVYSLTTEAHCDQVEQDFPGTNRCESRIITHLLTLQTSGGTLACFYLGKDCFLYLKLDLKL